MSWLRWFGGVLSVLGALTAVHASAQTVPVNNRAVIVFRSIAYWRGVPDSEIKIGVLTSSGDDDAAEMATAFAALANRVDVGGRSVRVLRISYSDASSVRDAVREHGVHVVYVPEGLTREATGVRRALGRANRLLVCTDPEAVGDGCHLAVEASGRSARVVISSEAARSSGVRFDARLLQLSRLVD